MNKLITASVLLAALTLLQTKAFAGIFDCKFKSSGIAGVKSIQLSDDNLVLNQELEIPLDKTRVKCGNFGRQVRFDGEALGFQVILKSCSTEAKLEGSIVDNVHAIAADVLCDPAAPSSL